MWLIQKAHILKLNKLYQVSKLSKSCLTLIFNFTGLKIFFLHISQQSDYSCHGICSTCNNLQWLQQLYYYKHDSQFYDGVAGWSVGDVLSSTGESIDAVTQSWGPELLLEIKMLSIILSTTYLLHCWWLEWAVVSSKLVTIHMSSPEVSLCKISDQNT